MSKIKNGSSRKKKKGEAFSKRLSFIEEAPSGCPLLSLGDKAP